MCDSICELEIKGKRKASAAVRGLVDQIGAGKLFCQHVNSVKYNAISCDYIRQLFQRESAQLLSQMLQLRGGKQLRVNRFLQLLER